MNWLQKTVVAIWVAVACGAAMSEVVWCQTFVIEQGSTHIEKSFKAAPDTESFKTRSIVRWSSGLFKSQ